MSGNIVNPTLRGLAYAVKAGMTAMCVCRLQWEDVTVGQALALTAQSSSFCEASHHRTLSSSVGPLPVQMSIQAFIQ